MHVILISKIYLFIYYIIINRVQRACQQKFGNYKISLSYDIICVILRLAVFTEYQSVTHTHTHTETDGQIHDDVMYCVSIASCGKNRPYCTHPRKYNYYAGNERWLIAKCTVIITYFKDNAQTPLNRVLVYMLYSQLCNTYGDKSNRWSVGLI